MTNNEYKLIKNIVLSEFDTWKTFKYMQKWDGYKPKTHDELITTIGESFKSVEENSDAAWVASGGFIIGFIPGDYFVISWGRNNTYGLIGIKNNKILTINDIIEQSDVHSKINYVEFLRMYKIYKLWQSKDKEITTTTQITNSAQE